LVRLGSADDFYAGLAADGKAVRARHNAESKPPLTTNTYTAHLLPGNDDWLRHRLEAGVRFVRRLEALIPNLVCVMPSSGLCRMGISFRWGVRALS
jgi:hypothetical protein